MSNVGSVGKFFLVPDLDRPMTLAPNAILLRSMTYSTYFLFQLLQTSSMTESINEKTTPGVQQKINKTDLKKIITNVPTLNESSMVGQMLSLLDNLIAATQDKIDALEQAKKALLQRLFDQSWRFKGYSDPWEKRKFKDLVVRVNKTSDDSTIPSVEFEDIISKQGRLNKDVRLKINSKQGIYFEPQDVLFGKLRPYLQNWLFPSFYGRAVGDFWVLRANSSVLSEYLFVLIQSPRFQIVANISSGTKMPRSDWNTVSNTSFPIPVQSEQRKIWQLFNVLDNLIAATQDKLSFLKKMKMFFLQQIFPTKNHDVPQIRFDGFTDVWSHYKLGSLMRIDKEQEVKKELLTDIQKGFYVLAMRTFSMDGYIDHSKPYWLNHLDNVSDDKFLLPREFAILDADMDANLPKIGRVLLLAVKSIYWQRMSERYRLNQETTQSSSTL